MSTVIAPSPPAAREFLAQQRGGGLCTELVNQRIGSWIALGAHRLGLRPTALTLLNLTLGVGASLGVVALAQPMAAGRVPSTLVGAVAFLLWHVAYSMDCADGQLARVTASGSPAGARVDILCDVAVQASLVAAVCAVAGAYQPLPPGLIAAFAACWMVNLITSLLATSDKAQSLVTSQTLPIRMIKLIRDYSAIITLIPLIIAVAPRWTLVVILVFLASNGVFLAASIAAAARSSLRTPQP